MADAFAPILDRFQPTQTAEPLSDDWRIRVKKQLFSKYFWFDFSPPHAELWAWANAIDEHGSPRPFVAIWPRGRGKSTTVEAVVADMAIRNVRHYCLYVCSTQDQADKHVATIARMLESDSVAKYAPSIGQPEVSRNGNKSWNRQRVTTATGFTVEAIGLDKAVRGQKIDWARPDVIVMDDIDEKHDSELTTTKKEETITTSIIPARATNCAVLFVQNLIHSNSIASRLAKSPDKTGAATYLMHRVVSGPFAAVKDLQYEQVRDGDLWRWEISGESLWHDFTIDICEEEFNSVGPHAYLTESQNDVDGDAEYALLTQADFDRTRVSTHPDLARVAVAVDPPGGATECGIVAGGKAKLGNDWHGYLLEDATMPKGVKPEAWALAVLQCYYRHDADVIFIERNYGGDMVTSTIRQTKWLDDDGKVIINGARVNIVEVVATRGKVVRAEPVATAHQQGRIHHVGRFDAYEKEWRQYQPGDKDSPNRLDSGVWLMTGLELVGAQPDMSIVPQAAQLFGSRETAPSTRGNRASSGTGHNNGRGMYGSRT